MDSISDQHYRNYTCYMPATNATRRSNTVQFFPTGFDMPATSAMDRLAMTIQDLNNNVKEHPAEPYLEQGTSINNSLKELQELLLHRPAVVSLAYCYSISVFSMKNRSTIHMKGPSAKTFQINSLD
jgi:hypothetical protein